MHSDACTGDSTAVGAWRECRLEFLHMAAIGKQRELPGTWHSQIFLYLYRSIDGYFILTFNNTPDPGHDPTARSLPRAPPISIRRSTRFGCRPGATTFKGLEPTHAALGTIGHQDVKSKARYAEAAKEDLIQVDPPASATVLFEPAKRCFVLGSGSSLGAAGMLMACLQLYRKAGALRLPQGDGDSGGFGGIFQGDIEWLALQYRVNEMQALCMECMVEALKEARRGQGAHA